MNTNKNFRTIGIISQVIGVLTTYLLIIGITFFWFKVLSKKFGVLENLILIPIILMIYFLGSSNYELPSKFIAYLKGNMMDKKFKLIWYKSVVSTFIILIASIGFYCVDFEKIGIYIIPILLLIPQAILLIKTSPYKGQSKLRLSNCKIKFSIMKIPQYLTTKEIYVISLIIGSIICLTLGYVFGEVQFHKASGKRVYFETEHSFRRFNYAVGIFSFIISSGISYLVLSKKFNNLDN